MSVLISVLHPTARLKPSEAFPRGWLDAHDVWLSRCDHPENVEYLVGVHESRWADVPDRRPDAACKWGKFSFWCNHKRDCVVDQLNWLAQNSVGKLLVGTMDDYYPPEHWDTLLLTATLLGAPGSGWDEEEYQLWCSSGSPRDSELIVAGAMTRKRYERYGWCLDPDFESMFADDWHTFVAKRDAEQGLCKLIQRFDIQFEHRHPLLGVKRADDVYALQNRAQAYRDGEALYCKKRYGTKSLAVCLPGENFPSRIFWDRLGLLNYLNQGKRLMVAPFGHHSTNVYHTRLSMTRDLNRDLPHVDLVLWIDDDNTCSVDQFELLYQDLEEHPELDGVVGWSWCDHKDDDKPWMMSVGRQGSWEDGLPAWNFTINDLARWSERGDLLITDEDLKPEGLWSGFPLVLMRGNVLRALTHKVFVPLVNEKFVDGFTGEDAGFFYRARVAGFRFAVDLRVESEHLKFRPNAPPGWRERKQAIAQKLGAVAPLADAAD